MVVTTGSVFGNNEANRVMLEIAWYKTPLKVVKDYFWVRDEELKNTKRLKELWVKWIERLSEVWCSKEQFDLLFNDVLDYGDNEWSTPKSDNSSITWTQSEWELEVTKKRARKWN